MILGKCSSEMDQAYCHRMNWWGRHTHICDIEYALSAADPKRHESMEHLLQAHSEQKPVWTQQCCEYHETNGSFLQNCYTKAILICWLCGISSANAKISTNGEAWH
jgi:hypothetical protein